MKGNIAIESIVNRFGLIIFIVLAFLLYGNTINHRFALDDEYVIKNDLVKEGVSAIPAIFTSYYAGNDKEKYGYRPFTRAVFAIETDIFGTNTKVFHFFNILYYGILCWLLYLLLRRLSDSIPHPVALIAVLLFLFHPVHTEVVNSLKNREELFCFILAILSVLSFLRFARRKNPWWLLAGGLLLFLSFLAKETAAVFVLIIPLVLLISRIDWMRFAIISIVAFVFVYLAYSLPGWVLPPETSHVENWQNPLFGDNGFWKKLSMGALTLKHYTWQLIFPDKLLFYYGYNMIPMAPLYAFFPLISLIAHLCALIYAFFNLNRNKPLAFGILFYFAGISLFSNIPIPITGIVGDRLAFVASAGFCLVLAFVLLKLNQHKKAGKALLFIIPVIFILYGYKTIDRNKDWESSETLFKNDIAYLQNSAKANDLYASLLLEKVNKMLVSGRKVTELGDLPATITRHFKRATEIDPTYYSAWNNLGAIYLSFFKDTANALFAFQSAINAKPDHVAAQHNIGFIYYKARKYEQAKTALRTALSYDSLYVPALFNMGEIFTIEQKFDSAERYFLRIHRLDSLHTGALLNLGSFSILKGDTARAIGYYIPAVEKDRSNKPLIMNIAGYFLLKGDTAKYTYYRKIAGM